MNNNQLQLVTFEQAKRLKKMGFDYPVRYCYISPTELCDNSFEEEDTGSRFLHLPCNHNQYDRDCSAPTIQLAFQWLRNERQIEVSIVFNLYTEYEIKMDAYSGDNEHYMYKILNRKNNHFFESKELQYREHSVCEQEALDRALNLLEGK